MSAPSFKTLALAAVLTAAVIGAGSAYTVNESEQAIVLQFGEYKHDAGAPGLHFKLPFFLQTVVYYDKRVIDLDLRAIDGVLLSDNRRLTVDAFVRYKITDPRAFYRAVTTESNFKSRLEPIVVSSMRKVLSRNSLGQMLSTNRDAIMREITTDVETRSKSFGIEIVDVRIGRADLPVENRDAVFRQMVKERAKAAATLRGEGQQESEKIRAKADRDVTVILAEANQKSQEIKADGDNEAGRIAAEAYGKDPSFYAFWRSLQTYRAGLGRADAAMILSPDSPAFKALTQPPPMPGQ